MKLVRGHAEARWLPSRHDAALFRLYAYLRLRRAKPEPTDAALAVDRHQSNAETWLVMSWLVVTGACYVAAAFFPRWHPAAAILVSLPITYVLIEVPAIFSGVAIAPLWRALTRTPASGIAVSHAVLLLLFLAASWYFGTQRTWVRFVAWQFLGVVALNTIAAAIVFLLRDSIARLEASIGGGTSGH